MSLYCQNSECGEYLGSLGGDSCPYCGWTEPVNTEAVESAATAPLLERIAELESDRDSWMQQASDRVGDAVEFAKKAEMLERELATERAVSFRDQVAQLEQRNRDLWEDVQRFRAHALNEKEARMALERELEAVRKDAGWRDIETAPKDGTAILLAYKLWPQFPSGPYGEVAQWDDFYCGWAGALPETQSDAAFSHWMPLPPPPDAAKEKP